MNSPGDIFQTAIVKEYWSTWHYHYRTDGVPTLDRLSLERMKHIMPHCFMSEREGDRFRFRLFGSFPTAVFGGDFTGRYHDEFVPDPEYDRIRDALKDVCEAKCGLHTIERLGFENNEEKTSEVLRLPLRPSASKNQLFMGVFTLLCQKEVQAFSAWYTTSPGKLQTAPRILAFNIVEFD